MPRLLSLLIAVSYAVPSLAAQVVLVTKSQKMVALSMEAERPWAINDGFCVLHDDREIACGRIVKTKEKVAFGRVDSRSEDIGKGDPVVLSDKRASGTSENEFFLKSDVDPLEWFNLADITLTSNWIAAGVTIQQSIGPKFALSLMGAYLPSQTAGSGRIVGFTLYGGLNYYSNFLYDGIWLQVGGGGAFYTGNLGGAEEKVSSLALYSTVGYRWRFGSGFNFSVAGGVQYFLDHKLDTIGMSFSGLFPSVIVDVGWIL